jgi:hypothetical protein
VTRFERKMKKSLQAAVDTNRKVLATALIRGVQDNPPERWRKFLGPSSDGSQMIRLLDHELAEAFGSIDDLIADMRVRTAFKGVTYELLSDPEFRRVALGAIPSLAELHEEYDAAKASGQATLFG